MALVINNVGFSYCAEIMFLKVNRIFNFEKYIEKHMKNRH